MLITRRTHPFVKEIQALRDHSTPELFFLEGPRLIQEALQASLPLQSLIISTAYKDKDSLAEKARAGAQKIVEVSPSVFDAMSDVQTPQGILAIVERPRWSWDHLLKRSPRPIVILDGLQNPGNVASIVRTAEASGAAGVITTLGTAQLFSAKALRGGMGSSLRLPSLEYQSVPDIISNLSAMGYQLMGTTVTEGLVPLITHLEVDWAKPTAVILGQEGPGLAADWTPALSKNIRIPMHPPVESLNTAAAATVLLYEAFRQREGGSDAPGL